LLDRFFLSAGEELPPGSILSFDMELILRSAIQLVHILLLFGILGYILYNPVKKFMTDRADRIRDDIDSARLNRDEAIGIGAEYQSIMDEIDKERERILSEARLAAVKKSDQILIDAQEEADYMKARARDEIKIERENAADEIKAQIAEISALIMGRFVESVIDREMQAKFIDEALADWGENA